MGKVSGFVFFLEHPTCLSYHMIVICLCTRKLFETYSIISWVATVNDPRPERLSGFNRKFWCVTELEMFQFFLIGKNYLVIYHSLQSSKKENKIYFFNALLLKFVLHHNNKMSRSRNARDTVYSRHLKNVHKYFSSLSTYSN